MRENIYVQITSCSKYEGKGPRNNYEGPILDWKVKKGLYEERILRPKVSMLARQQVYGGMIRQGKRR